MTWITKTIYVDEETGEVLTDEHIKQGLYVKMKMEKKYKLTNKHYGTREIYWRCQRNQQQQIEF